MRTLGITAAVIVALGLQGPAVPDVSEQTLRQYAGVYQWSSDAFLYLQLWNEFTGKHQLGAFDESGEVRVLYPTAPDRFFAGPGAAVSSSIESRIEFQRDDAGKTVALTWQRDGGAPRVARRVDIETRDEVRFANGDVALAGMLIRPTGAAKPPAIILVHGSGPQDRESILPFARFLVRRGIAILGYDKRGVGKSGGDWNRASMEDLAGDAVAAFRYLSARGDIDGTQIGLLGVSQAGWIMPLAAVQAPKIAFLISISGAGVPTEETAFDHTRNELTTGGMPADRVEQLIDLMKAQHRFARTGEGWDEYVAKRAALAARLGSPPDSFPSTQDHPRWQFMRKMFFYDPGPTLRQLRTPTLALFGELDNNILPDKNRAAWDTALKAAGNRDYTLRVIPKANHIHLEAKIGNNAEMPSLRHFAPEYFTTIHDWLAKRVRGYDRRAAPR